MSKLTNCITNKDDSCIPIWFTRQAGRYLPEFRKIRSDNKDFIKLCLDSDLSWSDCLGSYTFPDGTKYEGEWRDNKPNGQGTFTESDNNQNMKTFTYPDGATYIGQYKNNKREGQGSIIFIHGDKYVGQWKDDKKHGQGTYVY